MSSLLSKSIERLSQVMDGEKVIELALDLIDADPAQPRKTFTPAAMEELAASITAQGVLQPIVVVHRESRYLIVFGERRWRGARMAGKATVPAIVRQYSDIQIQAVRLLENRVREAVAAIEEAAAYKTFIDTLGNVHGVQKQAAALLGISEATLSQRLSLLTMPEEVKDAYLNGHIQDATTALDVARVHAADPGAASDLIEKAKGGAYIRAEVRESLKATKEKAGKKRAPEKMETPDTPRCTKTVDMWAGEDATNDSTTETPAAPSVCQNPLTEQQYAVLSALLDELAERPRTLDTLAYVIRVTLSRAQALGLDYEEMSAAINGSADTNNKQPGHDR